uniref:Uncharacterized protein n=1 Tax=Hyaloperonospora arabidopsidis (strain Emoy2) TaxID=559515 RepID=M4BFG0_HYAAE
MAGVFFHPISAGGWAAAPVRVSAVSETGTAEICVAVPRSSEQKRLREGGIGYKEEGGKGGQVVERSRPNGLARPLVSTRCQVATNVLSGFVLALSVSTEIALSTLTGNFCRNEMAILSVGKVLCNRNERQKRK